MSKPETLTAPPVGTNWVPVGPGGPAMPAGGSTGQALVKHSGTDFDVQWATPVSGSNITYRGAYAAGTTYNDGDIVVGADGITYLCQINGTVGVTPTPWGPGPITPYGTSLPSTPVDGMEAILVDSTTNPSYQWRFRYNAGNTGSYKWEFVGGTPANVSTGANEGTASTSYVTLPSGPSFTVPRAGIYMVAGSSRLYASAICQPSVGIHVDTTLQADYYAYQPAVNQESPLAWVGWKVAANPGQVINLRYKTTGGTAQFLNRQMVITPTVVA